MNSNWGKATQAAASQTAMPEDTVPGILLPPGLNTLQGLSPLRFWQDGERKSDRGQRMGGGIDREDVTLFESDEKRRMVAATRNPT